MPPPARQYRALERLYIGLQREQRQKRIVVALKAFIDESGSDERSPVFVFAGYVGTIAQLDHFADGWNEILATPPKVRFVKFTDANGERGEFYGINERDIQKKLKALTKFAKDNTGFSISVVVPKDDFERAISLIPFEKKDFSPWVLSFSAVMTAVSHYQKTVGMNEKVEFVFDEHRYAGKIQEGWDEFKSNCSDDVKKMLGNPPQFMDDKQTPALQAADILAGAVRSIWELELGGEKVDGVVFADERIKNPDLNNESLFHHLEFLIRKEHWVDYFRNQAGIPIFDDNNVIVDLSQMHDEFRVDALSTQEFDRHVLLYLDVCGQKSEYVKRPSFSQNRHHKRAL